MLERMPAAVLQMELRTAEDQEEPEIGLAFHDTSQPSTLRSVARGIRTKVRALGNRFGRKLQAAIASQLNNNFHSESFAAPPGFAHAAWSPLAPENVGGRTRSIVLDPTNPKRMWAGSLGGGIWRSDDGGENYQLIDDQMPSLIISCMVMDPTRPGTIYAGTGEDYFKIDGPRGVGIIKISDTETPTVLPGTDNSNFLYVNRLAISSDGRVLLAATAAGLFRTDDLESGVWTRSSELNFKVAQVLFDPRDSRNAVASGMLDGEVYFSTDGGIHWSAASHTGDVWTGRVELTYAASSSGLVYASVATKKNSSDKSATGEIWRSTNGGQSYEVRGSNHKGSCEEGACKKVNFLAGQGRYSNTIWAGDPIRPDLVIVGGVNLWRSEDGGDTLIDISSWFNKSSAHSDQHCIVSDPGFDGVTNNRVFFGNDGGVYETEDVHSVGNDKDRIDGWTALNHTYATIQFQGAAGNAEMKLIVGGTQDNGTWHLRLDGDKWVEVGDGFTGDGGFCKLEPKAGLIFGSGAYLDIYRTAEGMTDQEYLNGRIHTTEPQGINCPGASAVNRKPPPFLITDVVIKDSTNYIAPFVLDPNLNGRMLAGAASLWRTDNANAPVDVCVGPSWTAIKDPTNPMSPISSVALAINNSDLIWVGHNSGDVFKTEAGSSGDPRSTWVKMNDHGAWPARVCLRIVLDPKNPNIVYVAFAGYSPDNLWKTTDGGLHWTVVSNGLPAVPVLSFVVHPQDSSHVFVGTAMGAFASENGGHDWQPIGPTNSPVAELFFVDQTLFAATYGRGMFKMDLTAP
jgi:photosystem II stability/assembly factor-like uncharacterized protein